MGKSAALLCALAGAAGARAEWVTDTASVVIKSWDGTNLTADAHIPKATTAGERFPILIFANSWDCPQFEYVVEAVKLAEQGFLVLEYETRGWYGHEGMVTAAGPDEQKDVSSIIDYILSRQDWPSLPSKIALAGISYGGGLALLGAAHDARVTTAVVMSGWASMSQALFHNGSPNVIWGNVLLLSGRFVGRLDPVINEMWKQVLIGNETAFHDFTVARSAETFVDVFKKRPIPLFISSNMEDRLFESEDTMHFWMNHPGPKKLLLNQGIHASAELGALADLPNNYVWKHALAWLNQYLRGAAPPAQDPLVDFQLRSDKSLREQFFHWPSTRLAPLVCTMRPRGRNSHGSLLPPPLALEDGADDTITFGKLTGFSAGFPILGEVFQVFIDTRITSQLTFSSQDHAIWYYTKLSRETRVCGTPELSVDFTPSASKFQMVAYLWAVDGWNVGTLISHGTISCWNCTAGERITRTFQLRTMCEDIVGGLGLGIDMFSELYQPANTDSEALTFHYSNAFSLTVPEVLSGSDSSAFSLVI